MTNHEQKRILPETCKFTILKDLFVVCCASPPGYNRKFSDLLRISELARKYLERVFNLDSRKNKYEREESLKNDGED